MKIVEKYSHLNGEEYLIVHHNNVYEEIKEVIHSVNADSFKTKVSKEKGRKGDKLYSPDKLNRELKRLFENRGWQDTRYSYYVTTDYSVMQKLVNLTPEQQRELLVNQGVKSPIYSFRRYAITMFKAIEMLHSAS